MIRRNNFEQQHIRHEMFFNLSKIFFTFAFLLVGTLCAHAQFPDASSADGRKKEDYPDSIKETFAKQRIKSEEKEFNELIGRSEEAAKISSQIWDSYDANKKLTLDDGKKLDRLEKLIKKIRDDLGSENDNDNKEKPAESASLSYTEALKNISEMSSTLFDDLKKSGRFSISVSSIENSNKLLKLVRYVRANQN